MRWRNQRGVSSLTTLWWERLWKTGIKKRRPRNIQEAVPIDVIPIDPIPSKRLWSSLWMVWACSLSQASEINRGQRCIHRVTGPCLVLWMKNNGKFFIRLAPAQNGLRNVVSCWYERQHIYMEKISILQRKNTFFLKWWMMDQLTTELLCSAPPSRLFLPCCVLKIFMLCNLCQNHAFA